MVSTGAVNVGDLAAVLLHEVSRPAIDIGQLRDGVHLFAEDDVLTDFESVVHKVHGLFYGLI